MTDTSIAPQGSDKRSTRPQGAASPRIQERLEREARARRALFVASVAGLAATLGIVAISAGAPQVESATQPAAASEAPAQRIVAEVPVPPAAGRTGAAVVRIVAPAQDAPMRDVRTRATP